MMIIAAVSILLGIASDGVVEDSYVYFPKQDEEEAGQDQAIFFVYSITKTINKGSYGGEAAANEDKMMMMTYYTNALILKVLRG